MSALATARCAMETLFDPDGDLLGGEDQATTAPRRAGVAAREYDRADGAAAEPGRDAGATHASWTLDGTTGGGPMLDDLVAGVWEGLAAHRVVQCPVCASEMSPEYGAHALPIGGRCGSCGSTLR